MMLATFLQETMEQPGLSGPYFAIVLVVGLLLYLFVGYCLMVIANKTNTPNGWFGFIPILNYVLMLRSRRSRCGGSFFSSFRWST